MKRRKLIKSIGLLSLTGIVGLYSSCTEKEVKEKSEVTDIKQIKPKENELIVNRQKMAIQDTENPQKSELKHTPEISLKGDDGNGFTKVEITVGSQGIIHPSTAQHWIDYIKLYLDNNFVGEIKYAAGKARGFGSFYVKLENIKLIKAEIGCNLHGIWENTLSL